MPKRVKPLTETEIAVAMPRTRPRKLFDGDGLYLNVMPSGRKIWRMKYHDSSRRENILTFGHFPEISIAAAREFRAKARQIIRSGDDPRTEFNYHKLHPAPPPYQLEQAPSEIDREYVRKIVGSLAKRAIAQFEATLFPALARMTVADIACDKLPATLHAIQRLAVKEISESLEHAGAEMIGCCLRAGATTSEILSAMTDTRRGDRRGFHPGVSDD